MDDAELRALLAAQARLITELSERIAPARPIQPLGVLYDRYEAAKKAMPAWYSRRAMLLPFVERFRDRDASGLAVCDWTDYREARSTLAPSSRNTTLAYVKAMLGWAVDSGLLAERPKLCGAKLEDQKEHRETAPEEWEIQLLLDACEKQRERVMVLCACDSGMRRKEYARLEWSWVDRERMEIRLPDYACKNRGGGIVPMTRRELAAIDAMPHALRSPYVLANPRTGEPYALQMFTNWFRALALRAGVKAVPGETRVHGHDLRASFGTNASERGLRLEVIQRIMRHKDIEQTVKYTRRRAPDLARAREEFERGIERDKTRR